MDSERHTISGRCTLVTRGPDGREIERRELKNLITNDGRNLVARRFAGLLQSELKLSIVVGQGFDPASPPADGKGIPADANDHALVKQLAKAVASHVEVLDSKATVVATFPATGTGDPQELREAGILIEPGGGGQPVLYNRVVFPVVNKSPNMEMTLTWEVVF
jgi:hypothetical protein